ncbi:MAG: LCP family protein [Oscillospiraceae bacterium]|nr:LCP family protein [Oscillospiraceae bacterium]
MKLFGGTKGGAHTKGAVHEAVSDEVLEAAEAGQPAMEASAAPADDIVSSESSEAPVIDAPVEVEASAELPEEDGLMSSIAETLGLSPEEMHLEGEEGTGEVDVPTEGSETKKLSRKEKKAAKKAEKAAKKAAKKWSAARKVLVAAVLLMALCITGFAGYFVKEMWVTDETLDIYEADFTGDIIYADDVEQVQIDQGQQVEEIPLDETRKKGCYTFLVAARDVASGCTDVIIVGRFDTENHTINMVSIPRDTMTNRADLKINTAYQGNLASGGNGIDGLKREIKKLVGFEIDSYAIVDVEAVEKLIDAIGGVYFDVPQDMHYSDVSQDLEIHLNKGYQKLSGSDAVKLLRFRKGYVNGDLGRIEVQHDFIKALAEQMLDIGNIPNLKAAIDIYQEHVQSNLTPGMILFYAKHFLEMDPENINFVSMPQHMGGMVNNQSFLFISVGRWVEVINEYLNPYKDKIGQWHLDIKSSMDGGNSFYYTQGPK